MTVFDYQHLRGGSKKPVLQGRSQVWMQSVHTVREDSKLATFLRKVASAACALKLDSAANPQAGNAAEFFQQPHVGYSDDCLIGLSSH